MRFLGENLPLIQPGNDDPLVQPGNAPRPALRYRAILAARKPRPALRYRVSLADQSLVQYPGILASATLRRIDHKQQEPGMEVASVES